MVGFVIFFLFWLFWLIGPFFCPFLGPNDFFCNFIFFWLHLYHSYNSRICRVQSQFQLLLKPLSSFTFQRLFTFQTLLFCKELLNPHKNPVIFNQPTDRLNYRISTSNFLRSYQFVTMTSSRRWRQEGCLYPPISNRNTMVRGYFLEFMPYLVTYQTMLN